MALKKVNKKPIFTKNGQDYYPFWDSKTGKVLIQVENPSAADKPVFENGNWNVNADNIGLTEQEKAVYWETTKQSIQTSYDAVPLTGGQGGKKKKKAVLPQWVKVGINPNQTALTPGQPVLGTGIGAGVNGNQLNYGVPTPNLGETIVEAQGNFATYKKFFKGTEFQKVFDGAKYPYDMDTLHQDHVVISAMAYRPAFADELFSKSGSALNGGIQSKGNKFKRLSTIYLPMPAGIADANTVDWQGDELGALAADAMNNIGGLATGGAIGGILGLFGVGGAGAGASAADMLDKLGDLGDGDFKELAGASVNSKILNMAGYAVSPESILARKSGIIPNNNNELLFKGVTMRSFTFTYKMSPRNPEEADQIRKIIRYFKFNMAAKKKTGGGGANVAGGTSFFLGTPDIFEMKFMTNINGQIVENPAVGMMKPMALKKFGCNYTPDGLWAAYTDGQPVQVQFSCDFQELEPIFDTDYIGVAGENKNLRPVSDNAVGW